jgi:hypothetical protein
MYFEPKPVPAVSFASPNIVLRPMMYVSTEDANSYVRSRYQRGCMRVNAEGYEYLDSRPECQ